MREVLESLLANDEDITARAVARLHPTIKAASSIIRSESRGSVRSCPNKRSRSRSRPYRVLAATCNRSIDGAGRRRPGRGRRLARRARVWRLLGARVVGRAVCPVEHKLRRKGVEQRVGVVHELAEYERCRAREQILPE